MSSATSTTRISMRSIATVIGFLAFVEFTSGIIQGYYTPLYTAAASLTLAFSGVFWLFLIAWAVQGFYVVWLPLEIGIVFTRSRDHGTPSALTRRAAGILVGALELGAIAGALSSGALDSALPLQVILLVPAIAVVICFFVVMFGVKESPDSVTRRASGPRFDTGGLVLVALALVGLTGGLSLLRLNGPGSAWPWIVLALGVALFVPFSLYELRQAEPLVNVRLFRSSSLWPVSSRPVFSA